MKSSFTLVTLLAVFVTRLLAQVAINNDQSQPDGSAGLDVKFSNKGFLPPRLTTLQRNAIVNPAEGLTIYNTELKCLEFYTGQEKGWYCPCSSAFTPDCNSVTVGGSYRQGVPLNASNTITVTVNVTTAGSYDLATETVNGYSFSKQGTFNGPGEMEVILPGSGTPQAIGTDDFTIGNGRTVCNFSVSVTNPEPPVLYRSGVFLHHSTGANIWGPNGSTTSVPQEMVTYNNLHGYTGDHAVTMEEQWYPSNDNEWVTWHEIFEDPDPNTGIGAFLPDNKIIVIKSCFPSSSMTGAGSPQDTLSPYIKSVYNYKWHWRHIVRAIRLHPQNFFVIWTNAPLEPFSTNLTEAALSKWFCAWAKDTLAAGLDPQTGVFPLNAYVFDFFHKLTGPNGMMLSMYAAGPGDSHPNAAATQLVAPQFVSEIFNAAIAYETVSAVPAWIKKNRYELHASPNPATGETSVFIRTLDENPVSLYLYDSAGKKISVIAEGIVAMGGQQLSLSTAPIPAGIYRIILFSGQDTHSIPLVIRK